MTRPAAWLCLTLALCACERVGSGYVSPGGDTATSSPSATPVASASPGANCATAQSATIFIGMSTSFAETSDTTYGEIAGYADVTTLEATQADVIQATTADTVQFVNLDSATTHSAVAFPQTTTSKGFPGEPYSFPTAAASPIATAITQSEWSTGRIPASETQPCLSQVFTLPNQGTYYFGDLDYYNTITSLRDVLVVSAPTASNRRRIQRRAVEIGD